MKEVRSWSQPDRPGIIGRKRVDWSVFLYGSHIPHEFVTDFEAANDGFHVERGQRHELALLVDGQQYSAHMVNIRSRRDTDHTQIRYDGNSELKTLMRTVFAATYSRLKSSHNRKGDDATTSQANDGKASHEYIEFYKTLEPFVYRVELISAGLAQGFQRNVVDLLPLVSEYIQSAGFQYSYSDLCNFYLSLRTKPFVILAGISGTGKSQLPRLFAKAISANTEPIAVRPDWNDGSDLLGYSDLEGRFRPGALTKLIVQANADPETPMLVVLDEMNLARVEHYMSDLLSVMETRTIKEDGTYTTKSLFGNTEFKDEADAERFGLLTLPDNLYIIGTVNMDETTHPFSKKVLDRANTIEFSDVDLTGYRSQTVEQVAPIVLTNEQLRGKCIHLSHALAEDSEYVDGVVDKLAEVNKVLSQANLQIGYRVRDEVAIYMLYNHQLGLLDEDVAFDYQLMQKILPRLQGSSQPIRRVLVQLLRICGSIDLSNTNDDLLSKLQEFEARGKAKPYPRSATKLVSMLRRLQRQDLVRHWNHSYDSSSHHKQAPSLDELHRRMEGTLHGFESSVGICADRVHETSRCVRHNCSAS